jgi:flagellar protein FlaJ
MSPEVSDVFSRLDSTAEKGYSKTKRSESEEEKLPPRLVRLQKGLKPDYIKLSTYQAFCWKVFGKQVMKGEPDPKLEDVLLQAHMSVRAEEYKAYVWMTTLLGAVASIVVALFLYLFLGTMGLPVMISMLVPVMVAFLMPMIIYVVLNARDIDKRIGPAMSFISALASANVNVDIIFKELARQEIYGEIKREAEWITRDTELLGIDILTAVSRAASRTPSMKFQDFLQGVVTTSTSGGRLKPYFLQKADLFERESRLQNASMLETLGLMAETYVTVVVAFPLFLVVIMAVMTIVGSGSADYAVTMLYIIVGAIVPLSQAAFVFFVWNMTEESRV